MTRSHEHVGWVGICARTLLALSACIATSTAAAHAQSGGGTALSPSRQMGEAPRWGASMPVTPYSQVNLETGRVLTTLPVVGWSGRGPSVEFALYHNAPVTVSPYGQLLGDTNNDAAVDAADLNGFISIMSDPNATEEEIAAVDCNQSLVADSGDVEGFAELLTVLPTGEGHWSHSYSRHLRFNYTGKIVVVWDDGSEDHFVYESGAYVAPPGVFWKLTVEVDANDIPTGYMLTHKSLIKNHFHADGKLDYVADASVDCDDGELQIRNRVTCMYYDTPNEPMDGKLRKVTDAAGRELTLAYNSQGKLMLIKDPLPGAEQRTWTLHRATSNPPDGGAHPEGRGVFVWLELPPEADQDGHGDTIKMAYTGGKITEIRDLNGQPYTLAYSGGTLASVTNPLSQTVSFSFTSLSTAQGEVLQRIATYTDVRGNDWGAAFDSIGNLIRTTDPLSHQNTAAYEDTRSQLAHEVTSVTNALNKTWTATYDDQGNVTSLTDPLSHTTTYAYTNSHDGPVRLQSVTPAGITAKKVQLEYEAPCNPMMPTSVVLPADGQGNPEAKTQFSYYGAEKPNAYGLLESVGDANGVVTSYTYDEHGQRIASTEGSGTHAVACVLGRDDVGRTKSYSTIVASGNKSKCLLGQCIRPDSKDKPTEINCNDCVMLCPLGGVTWDNCRELCDVVVDPLLEGSISQEEDTVQYPWSFLCPRRGYGLGVEPSGPTMIEYDAMGSVLHADTSASTGDYTTLEEINCSTDTSYDAISRVESITHETSEPAWFPLNGEPTRVSRYFNFTYNDAGGIKERVGPDNQITRIELDAIGRKSSIKRGWSLDDPQAPQLSVAYTYYDDNRLDTAVYGDGSRLRYWYDSAGRLNRLRHEWTESGDVILDMEYTLSDDGLITQILETGPNGWDATVAYFYDNRNQLIREQRTGTHPYHITYSYDQAGNRTSKHNVPERIVTTYHYDIDGDVDYGTWNNRLMYYEETCDSVLTARIYYEYNQNVGPASGSVSRIVREVPSNTGYPSTYWATEFTYDRKGEVWLVLRGHWDSDDHWCEDFAIDHIDEFRGSGRARHLARERNPAPDWSGEHLPLEETAVWSDYSDDAIYGDYSYDAATQHVTELTAYLPGVGRMDNQTGNIWYFHRDHIGTLRAITHNHTDVARLVYTAFGEIVYADGDSGERYGYAGHFGYQTRTGFPYVHIGYRYYDPATGRFLQRDPIGIAGGLNVYAYVSNSATGNVDPLGLMTKMKVIGRRLNPVPQILVSACYTLYFYQPEVYVIIYYVDDVNRAVSTIAFVEGVGLSVTALLIPEPISTLAGGCGLIASVYSFCVAEDEVETGRAWVPLGPPVLKGVGPGTCGP